MNILDAVFQGLVQGLTEFLPVSSSGHLVLSQHVLGIQEHNLLFDVMLHIGTLFSVVAFYHKKILKLIKAFFKLIKDIATRQFKISKLREDENMVVMLIIGLFPLFLLFLPIFPGAKNVKDIAEDLSSGNYIILTGMALLITSFLLYRGIKISRNNIKINSKRSSNELLKGNKKNCISIYDALFIGLSQFFAAVFPGLSRSGSTLSTGLMRGLSRQTSLEYSFILGIPAVVAAALLEVKEAVETDAFQDVNILALLIGMVVSAIVGFIAIKLLKWLLETNKMKGFVIYTFILGIITVVIGLIEIMNGVNIFTGVQI